MITKFTPRGAPKPPPEPPKPPPVDETVGTCLKMFTDNPERIEVFEVDAAGKKVRFRGNFESQAMALRYMNGRLKPA